MRSASTSRARSKSVWTSASIEDRRRLGVAGWTAQGLGRWLSWIMAVVCLAQGPAAAEPVSEAASRPTHHSMEKIVIAHRGASAYLPEHTLEAKAMAHALGAHYLEQDLVMTRDDQLLVIHDIHLDTVTDVAARYPDRARPDGRFYAIDFDLAELRELQVTERIDPDTGQAVFPGRFPVGRSRFRLHTLQEEIELIQGLNRSSGKNVGLYPEIKAPQWHQQQGKDLTAAVLKALDGYGYNSATANIFVQCFDPLALQRLAGELGAKMPLVQLIGDNRWNESSADYAAMLSPAGLQGITTYAQGIAPWLPQLFSDADGGQPALNKLVEQAHRAGLVVHPYTLRREELPRAFPSAPAFAAFLFSQAGVDGLFADSPDDALAAPRGR